MFANKPIVLVINKIDQVKPEDLPAEQRAWIEEIMNQDNATVLTMSCYNEEGVMNVRNSACDKLLAARVEMKMSGNKINDVINKIHLATPTARDGIVSFANYILLLLYYLWLCRFLLIKHVFSLFYFILGSLAKYS